MNGPLKTAILPFLHEIMVSLPERWKAAGGPSENNRLGKSRHQESTRDESRRGPVGKSLSGNPLPLPRRKEKGRKN